jgi:hypothetical protein
MSLLSLLAIALLCWLSCSATAGAAEPSPAPHAIWSGLVFATNNPHPAQAPDRLRMFAQKLKNIFGYNQFELVGEYAEKMGDPYERWLIPSKDFSLSVKTFNQPGERYPTRIVLYQNHRRLAEIQTHLNSDSPLFIRGPQYGGGQLVIVLHVVDASEVPARVATPVVAVNPAPVVNATPWKVNPTPASFATVPKEPFYPTPADHAGPMPADHLGPGPADRFGPMPADHLGPLPGDRAGDMDGKLNRP